jgi:nicotinamide mononucleotide adenylyltransferase
MRKYNLFIGRFQSPHKGHQAIFDKFLSKGEPILIAIRDVPTDENNPLSAYDVHLLMRELYADNPLVKVIVFPDIASVNYGRGVGYEVNELIVEKNIAEISASEIRNRIKNNDPSWKQFVDEKIWTSLEFLMEQK